MILKKIILRIMALLIVLGISACAQKKDPNTIVVGTIAGPETQLMEVAKQVAKKRYGLNIKIVTFSDYNVPNAALQAGSLDANVFQHMPFLQSQIKARNYQIVSIGKTFIFPMGLYSKKITHLSELKPKDIIAIPNDPSNEGRALLLLQKAKLIQLQPNVGFDATPVNIVHNPKHLKFVELDAAELPRVLNDVSLAAINTTFALPAGLSPTKNALFHEGADSPYVNIIAVRKSDKNNPKLLELVKAYQSKQVEEKAKELFGEGAIAAWKTHALNNDAK